MSYILDALRKSEAERRRDSAVPLAGTPQAAMRPRIPTWTWLVIGVLVVATAGLGGQLLLRGAPTETPAPAPVPAGARDAAPAPSAPAEPAETARPATGLRPIAELTRTAPELPGYRLGVLAFSPSRPDSSSAWINGRRYFVGERLDGGPELSEIRADGVVLLHNGQRYLLATR